MTESAVNWEELVKEYMTGNMTIREFAKAHKCTERAFKYHLYRDPGYTPKSYRKRKNQVNLIPVKVDTDKSEAVRVNGFDIEISVSTGDEALAKVLSAIRRIS